jgi:hypothetical protein
MSTHAFCVVTWHLILASAAMPQQRSSIFDPSCIESLELPTRGLLAARSPTSGTVRAEVHIGDQGRTEKLVLTGGNPFLEGEVHVALKGSRFAPRCQGRKLEFVFGFTMEEPARYDLIPPAVRFIPPNRFELIFKRLKPHFDHTGPRGPNVK